MKMIRRPAAHNPMIFRKTAKPAGRTCTEPGCVGFIRTTETECPVCAFNKALAEIEEETK